MKILTKILLATGLVLLGLNIFGLFKSMRNPAVYSEEMNQRNRIHDITIRYPEIIDMLRKEPDESDVDFGMRINKVVNDGFMHYWKSEGIEKYHMRVPLWENYILYFASYMNPEKYAKYEFSNYKKNLERGVGLCSTHSTIVKGVLLENGIKAELMDVGGHHVVVRAELNDTAIYMLDPDFGVVVPHDTAAITANPELVRAHYSQMASLYYPDAKDPYTTDILVDIFGDRKYTYEVEGNLEKFAYPAIWILPLLLILPFAISLIRKNHV